MKIRKSTLALGIFLVSLLVVSSFFVIASSINEKESPYSPSAMAKNPCAKSKPTGTCTNGDKKCKEDVGGTYACQYTCGPSGWDDGEKCSYNACHGGECAGEGAVPYTP